MEIRIKGDKAALAPEEGETLGHLFMRIEDHCQNHGLTIVGCELDGTPADIARQRELSERPAGGFNLLVVDTVDNDNLAIETLTELKPLLEQLGPEAESTAAALQSGQTEGTNARIDSILQVWAVLFETILNSSRLYAFRLEDVTCGDRNLSVMTNALSELLKEIEEALGNRDTVTVADVLEYEIAPSVGPWMEGVDAVIAHITTLKSDGKAG